MLHLSFFFLNYVKKGKRGRQHIFETLKNTNKMRKKKTNSNETKNNIKKTNKYKRQLPGNQLESGQTLKKA
jgi:hypothetical protein